MTHPGGDPFLLQVPFAARLLDASPASNDPLATGDSTGIVRIASRSSSSATMRTIRPQEVIRDQPLILRASAPHAFPPRKIHGERVRLSANASLAVVPRCVAPHVTIEDSPASMLQTTSPSPSSPPTQLE